MQIRGTKTVKERPEKKRGRPPKNAVAMTPAERQAASRMNRKRQEQDAEREELIDALMEQVSVRGEFDKKWYLRDFMKQSIEELRERKNLLAALLEIYRSQQAHIISKVKEHRMIARSHERVHLRELICLSIENLRLASDCVSGPSDIRGRLPNERRSGGTSTAEIERMAAARQRNSQGRRVKPTGEAPT